MATGYSFSGAGMAPPTGQYVTKHHEVYMMYFVKIDQLQHPEMTTALQTCYNINADWHTYFLELKQLLFL
jgi:hypothetical protein